MNEGNPWTSAPTACSWNSVFHFSCEQIHRAERFCWNNSWVTNRKQLVQLICRKIQGSCQRKSCWKRCFQSSQRIVSQAKSSFCYYPSSSQTQLQLYQHRCPGSEEFLEDWVTKKQNCRVSVVWRTKQSQSRSVCLQVGTKPSQNIELLVDSHDNQSGSSVPSGPTIKIKQPMVR